MINLKEDALRNKIKWWIFLAAIFLISLSLIVFEITLSRILSVLLSYHYVFVVLSLALLGLGMGGLCVHIFGPKKYDATKRFLSLPLFTCLFSLTLSFSVLLMILIGYLDVSENILIHGFLLFLPFFSGGVVLAEVYRMFPAVSATIYGVDLVGAALGALIVTKALDLLGGINGSFLLGVVASVGGLLFAIQGERKNRKGIILSISSLLIASILFIVSLTWPFLPDLPIGKNSDKEIHEALYESSFKGKILETRWSAFGRTDLVGYPHFPDRMDIYIDGTAGSPMYKFNGKVDDPGTTIESLKKDFPGYFPFVSLKEEEKNHALVIGPGGGRDILLALMGGVQKITAVEVDRDLVHMVQSYSWYNGGIYNHFKNVKIVVDEGRSFLKRQKETYDLILLSLPVTNTSRSLEGYALTENFLFTTDAIHDYLDHLTEEGRLIVVGHNDAEILRLLSISLTALNEKGISQVEAMKRIYILGSDEYPVFVMKKAPFEQKEMVELLHSMIQRGVEKRSSYLPYFRQEEGLNPALAALGHSVLSLNGLIRVVKESGFDISPVTDDSPFFYKIHKGMPKPVSFIFWLSIIVVFLVIWVPFLLTKRNSMDRGRRLKEKGLLYRRFFKPIVLFLMLGIGFMLIEISLIQKFALFLGQPVLSLAILLFSLLGWAGAGSLWSGRLSSDKISRGVAIISLLIAVIVLIYVFILPMIFNQLFPFDLKIRLLATIFILGPLGFLMGFAFPLGIRALQGTKMEYSIPWMWGINGVGSVLGSAMAVFVAISLGFTEALLISAGLYLIISF